jgi:nicotinamidase-related amidase
MPEMPSAAPSAVLANSNACSYDGLMPTALLLIDAQRNMLLPPEPVVAARSVAAALSALLARAREAEALVVHIRNNGGPDDPDRPGTDGWQLVHEPLPGEPVVDKSEQDAFAGTGLADLLPATATLVLAGMQSEFCVTATALAALSRGHRVVLASGAHSTYDGEVPAQVEQRLAEAGVRIVPAEAVAFD